MIIDWRTTAYRALRTQILGPVWNWIATIAAGVEADRPAAQEVYLCGGHADEVYVSGEVSQVYRCGGHAAEVMGS